MLVQSAGLDDDVFADAGGSSLLELGLDSLAAMELQAIVKSRYGVRIPDECLEMSMPEIVEFIETERTKEGS